MPEHHSKLATLGGFGAILFWSTTFGVSRRVSEQIGAYRAGAAVFLVATALILLGLLASPKRREQFRHLALWPTVVCGLLFVANMVVIYIAIDLAENRSQMLVVGLLNYLWPPLTILLSIPLLKAKGSFLLAPATIIAVTGVYFVMVQGNDASLATLVKNLSANPIAYLLITGGAVAWAFYSNLTRRWSADAPSGDAAAGLFLAGTAVALLVIALAADEAGEWTWRAGLEVLFLGLANYFGYTLWETAMRRGNLTLVAAASYFTPLLSTAISCTYLGVLPGTGLLVGCVMLVAGSVMSWISVNGEE